MTWGAIRSLKDIVSIALGREWQPRYQDAVVAELLANTTYPSGEAGSR